MSDQEFQGFLNTMITEGCVDVRVLTKAILEKFGGEQGLADMIFENYVSAEGTAKATHFGMIMKLLQAGIDADKNEDPLSKMSQDQLHRTITKFLKVSSTNDERPGVDIPDQQLPSQGGPPTLDSENGVETGVSFKELVDSVHAEVGVSDGAVQSSPLRERLPFLYGEEKDNPGLEPSGEDT